MKKIMFNETYGLQRAAIDGTKPMTRRIESGMENLEEGNFCFLKRKQEIEIYGEKGTIIETIKPRYKVGEVVAIAQSYKDAGYTKEWVVQNIKPNPKSKPTDPFEKIYPGWTNKMFVKAEFMPHRIQFTDLKVERLQDISDEDCMKEGVDCAAMYGWYVKGIVGEFFTSPREAFAALIDKVSGRGTWKRNQWVFVYTFEILKEGGKK